VTKEETIDGFARILSGEMDDVPEAAFYNKGTIEQVLAEAQKMKEEVVA
jgi:F-type H+-transporting ATPase subunit beta